MLTWVRNEWKEVLAIPKQTDIFNGYNMGGLPDMYTQIVRATGEGWGYAYQVDHVWVPLLQPLYNMILLWYRVQIIVVTCTQVIWLICMHEHEGHRPKGECIQISQIKIAHVTTVM